MAVYVVTGKLGSGKTLVAVGKIQDKICSGCKVATNLDLNLSNMPKVGRMAKSPRVMRVPDKPCIDDLLAMGRGNDTYDEDKNGLLVLDECGTWFNTRSWNDKERQKVINWFLHARKLGWDIIFLIQDLSMMDKQARVSLAEHVVYCKRTDRLSIPVIGAIYSAFLGTKIPLPKVHIGVVKYGDSPQSITVGNWVYTGRNFYTSYDTYQAFTDNYPHGLYSLLPPFLIYGYKAVPKDKAFYMRMTKVYWKRFSRPICLAAGLVAGTIFAFQLAPTPTVNQISSSVVESVTPQINPNDLYIKSSFMLGDRFKVLLSDGNKDYSESDIDSLGYRLSVSSACNVSLRDKNDETQNYQLNC